jgi:hypothetical protein
MEQSIIDSILNYDFFNKMDYFDFLPRFIINLIFIYVIAVKIYYNRRKDRDYLFTMFIFNFVIFVVCYTMSHNELSIGFAFSMFAVFSILRYRTETVPIKEMTYLFVAISMAVINALSTGFISIGALISADLSIVIIILLLETLWVKNVHSKDITYEKIELIKPDRHKELIEDLSHRTGLNINRVEIGKINFLNDTATIKIFYFEKEYDV